jgi:DNA-binding transcriptional regulator YhcF (GntR family)
MAPTSFNFEKPIYRQIIDIMAWNVASGAWLEDGRIPAIRELATEYGVNPNTVMRAFESLQRMKIIESRRGVGFFVAEGAYDRLRKRQREVFLSTETSELFARMDLIGVSMNDLVEQYEIYKKQYGNENKH